MTADLYKSRCRFFVEIKWRCREYTSYTTKMNRREEIMQININNPFLVAMHFRVGLDAPLCYKTMHTRFLFIQIRE